MRVYSILSYDNTLLDSGANGSSMRCPEAAMWEAFADAKVRPSRAASIPIQGGAAVQGAGGRSLAAAGDEAAVPRASNGPQRNCPPPRVTRWNPTKISKQVKRFTKTVTATAASQKWSALPAHRGAKLNRSGGHSVAQAGTAAI